MNMKSLAALGIAGLLAASVIYTAPAMAEEMSASAAGMDNMLASAGASDSAVQPNNDGTSDMIGNDGSNGDSAGSAAGSNSGTGSDASGAAADQGSPDTATGDDDY